jgi:PAS domain S-box-containing protein
MKPMHMPNQPLRLLMVDDDQEDFLLVQQMLQDALSAPSVRLDYAANCAQALSKTQQQRYDLLLVDYRLPGETGITLLRELKNCQLDAPVIMLTGQGDEAVAVEAMKAGALDYLSKSKLNEASLRLAVRYAVNLHRKEHLLRDARAQVQSNERRFRALADNTFEAIHLLDREGAILWASRGNQRLFGYTPEELCGSDRHDFIHPDDVTECRTVLRDCAANPDGRVAWEFRHRHKNGGWRNVEVMATNRLDDPAIAAIFTNLRDVTERRGLQQQLLQAQKMEAVGQLAGGVAHDFNNLLMVISSYSEILLESVSDPRQRHQVGQVLNAARRAATLTQQLLAFGRKQVLAPRILDLNAVIGEIARTLPRLIGEDIRVCVRPGSGLGKVKADPVQIEQVIMNLAANARDAMPAGGTLTIETANVALDEQFTRNHSAVKPGLYALLSVSDTGTGIAPEIQAHIFEPFFTTKERGKGTGLGLPTVYGIVQQSGGYLWLESEPGRGATFKICLPVVEQQEASRPAPPSQHRIGGDETILLVEDEEAVRESTTEFLRSCGYTVLAAGNGSEAIQIGAAHPGRRIDLLLTDVVMPGMSGPELADLLRSSRPDTKVLYMSGYAETAMLERGVAELSTVFLQKPFTLAALARRVREVIEAAPHGAPPEPLAPLCDTAASHHFQQ